MELAISIVGAVVLIALACIAGFLYWMGTPRAMDWLHERWKKDPTKWPGPPR